MKAFSVACIVLWRDVSDKQLKKILELSVLFFNESVLNEVWTLSTNYIILFTSKYIYIYLNYIV